MCRSLSNNCALNTQKLGWTEALLREVLECKRFLPSFKKSLPATLVPGSVSQLINVWIFLVDVALPKGRYLPVRPSVCSTFSAL